MGTWPRKSMAGLHRLFRFIPALGILVAAQGCATAGSDNPFAEGSNLDVFQIWVQSRNSFDVSIFVNPAGKRLLVGTVPQRGAQFFTFEYPGDRALRIELETRTGDRHRLAPIIVSPGDRIQLLIADRLSRSSIQRGTEGLMSHPEQ